jgi:hypothetical protein
MSCAAVLATETCGGSDIVYVGLVAGTIGRTGKPVDRRSQATAKPLMSRVGGLLADHGRSL